MIEDYAGYITNLRPGVVDSIGSTPSNTVKLKFLHEVIPVETNEDAVVAAIRNLLSSLKLPRGTVEAEQFYRRMVAELRSENFELKRRALAEIRVREDEFLASQEKNGDYTGTV